MGDLFRLLIVRLLINLADSIFFITTLWYINDHFTGNIYLGIFMAILYIPDLLLIFFGPLVDRMHPKKTLIMSVIIQLLSVVSLLVFRDHLSFPFLLLIAFFAFMASSVSYIIEDVLIPQLVDYNQIVFANTLFSVSYKALDSLFNAVSSILKAVLGFMLLLRLDMGIFGFALILLFILRFKFKRDMDNAPFNWGQYQHEVKDGTKFIKNNAILLSTTWALIFVNFFTAIYNVGMPIFSAHQFDGPIFYGIFLTVGGLGTMLGNVLANFLIKRVKVNQMIGGCFILQSLAFFFGIIVNHYFISLACFFVSYVFSGCFNIIFQALYQQIPPVQLLGRVNTSVDTYITIGMPLGSLVGGWLFEYSVQGVLIALCVPTILFGIYFLQNKHLKQYQLVHE